MNIVLTIMTVVALAASADDCSGSQNVAEQRDNTATAQLTQQASTQVGLPAIRRFTEKRNLKMLYELRDDPKLATIAYTQDMQGHYHKLCDSIGYGFPYATQYTSPERDTYYPNGTNGSGTAVHFQMPQPEPNGLFMPAGAEGTWVMCLNPATKQLAPVYSEPRVIVSPFPLD